MLTPRLSILMPVYNGETHLEESIRSLLVQEFSAFELLILDDASTDRTPEILSQQTDPRIRTWRHRTNAGLVASLNELLESAKAPVVARQDHDDWSRRDRLMRQWVVLEGHPQVTAVFSHARLIDEKGRFCGRMQPPSSAEAIRWDLCFRNSLPHSSAMFRRDAALKLGGYPDSPACEDYDLWSQMAFQGEVVSLTRPLVRYRIHEESIMGRENKAASSPHTEARCKIAERNIKILSEERLDSHHQQRLVDVWQRGKIPSWKDYFSAREAFVEIASAHERIPRLASLLAEEDYALYGRVHKYDRQEARKFLAALACFSRSRLYRLPWLRMAAMELVR